MRLGWSFGAIVALAVLSACGGDDVSRICNAEAGAHASAATDEPVVRRWIEAHVRTVRGRALASQLFRLPTADRHRVLRTRAAEHGLLACPLADAWDQGARADTYAQDLRALCAMSPPLDPYVVVRGDDEARIEGIRAWAYARARTPRLFSLVDRIATAPPRARGAVVRFEVQRLPSLAEERCALADALDTPVR